MQALVFQYSFPRLAAATLLGRLSPAGYLGPWGPLSLRTVPVPSLPGEDWVLLRTSVCGICGSDAKQVFLDGNFDNPMTAFVSFPQVLGHEVVGVVEQVGREVSSTSMGERVVLDPWLSCATRGYSTACEFCQRGETSLCQRFTEGALPAGIHIGNNQAVPGGFGPWLVAHQSQLHPVPGTISDEQAVLADPYAVSLHAVLKAPPEPGELAVVYGCGTLGLLTLAILGKLFPETRVLAITRYSHQEDLARRLGAGHLVRTHPPAQIIELVAEIVGTKVYRPWRGLPTLLKGATRIYDTVGTPQSLEVGIRLANPHAKIVVTGVASPRRFEWTPLYFKEIELIGSNAFGVESWEGHRQHAIDLALEWIAAGVPDLSEIITHRFPLQAYREAFLALHDKEKSGAVKVLFMHRRQAGSGNGG